MLLTTCLEPLTERPNTTECQVEAIDGLISIVYMCHECVFIQTYTSNTKSTGGDPSSLPKYLRAV